MASDLPREMSAMFSSHGHSFFFQNIHTLLVCGDTLPTEVKLLSAERLLPSEAAELDLLSIYTYNIYILSRGLILNNRKAEPKTSLAHRYKYSLAFALASFSSPFTMITSQALEIA